MKRDKLTDAMARRSPLVKRESVDPVDLYNHTLTGEPEAVAVNNVVFPQTDSAISGQVDVATSQHVDNQTQQLIGPGETPRRRYTTYLKPETIKAIKWHALDRERNDYDVVQEALDEYLQRHKR